MLFLILFILSYFYIYIYMHCIICILNKMLKVIENKLILFENIITVNCAVSALV